MQETGKRTRKRPKASRRDVGRGRSAWRQKNSVIEGWIRLGEAIKEDWGNLLTNGNKTQR